MTKEKPGDEPSGGIRRRFSGQEKTRIVLEGLRRNTSVAVLCQREGIAPPVYHRWKRAFIDAGQKTLSLDTQDDASTEEIRQLKKENCYLKKAIAEASLEIQKLKSDLAI